MPSGRSTLRRIAIVGPSTLLGKELKQVLEDRRFPAADVVLLDETVAAGTLTEAAGEPTFIRALDEDSFEGAQFAFFARAVPEAGRNFQAAQRAGATVIDLTGALAASNLRPAMAWIPSLGSVFPPLAMGGNGSSKPIAYASPAAPVIVACTLAAGLAKFDPRCVAITLFPPVSERDQEGIEELESQTASLLSFREIGRPVFDAQVAFNLLASYGPGCRPRLADVRQGIASEVAAYLAGRAPVPAIQLVQAPVFHGYAFTAYAELAEDARADDVEAAFAKLSVKVAGADDPAPSNVSVAGESEIHMGRIERDPNVAGGLWIWGVADNLRLTATNAVRIAEELVAKSPN